MFHRDKLSEKIKKMHDGSVIGASLQITGFQAITGDELDYMKSVLKVGIPTICISEKDFLIKFFRQQVNFDAYIDNLADDKIIDIYENFELAVDLSKEGPRSPGYKDQVKKIVSIVSP